eukprot:Amastigsp_a11383_16.p1 type:complete len:311 gc:universal Amastigsp_a11383_16:1593-661(-)
MWTSGAARAARLCDAARLIWRGYSVAPTAIVHRDAKIAVSATIGPYSIVGAGVEIMDGAVLEAHCHIEGHTVIGPNVHVHPFACIGGRPQDLKYRDEPTRVVIGAHSVIREHATIHRGTAAHGVTEIGERVFIMSAVHVAHDCVIAPGAILSSGAQLAGHVVVGERAIIGGQAAVHQFTEIGAGAMIGGLAAVRGHVAPFCLAKGNTARLMGLNLVGLRRRGLENAHIRFLQAVFAFVFKGERGRGASAALTAAPTAESTTVARAAALLDALEHVPLEPQLTSTMRADARAIARFVLAPRRRTSLCMPEQ